MERTFWATLLASVVIVAGCLVPTKDDHLWEIEVLPIDPEFGEVWRDTGRIELGHADPVFISPTRGRIKIRDHMVIRIRPVP